MRTSYTFLKGKGFENILKIEKEGVFSGYIAVHNTTRGPALGGCRIWKYDEKEDALLDAMALAEAMSYKNCMADLPYGGGKTAIHVYDTNYDKFAILEDIAHGVEKLDGSYIIAEDVGVSCEDLDSVRKITNHVVEKAAGDPGPITAKGVFYSIEWYRNTINKLPENMTVLVQGVGSVGRALVRQLLENGYKVAISDIRQENIKEFENRTEVIEPSRVYEYECDVFAPCALGGVINDETVKKFDCKAIIGSANNPVSNINVVWKLLERGIFYAPDFIVNAGGVIQVTGFVDGVYNPEIVEKKLLNIPLMLESIRREAEKTQTPDYIIALRMAKLRLKLA